MESAYTTEVLDLVKSLKEEKLFVDSEKRIIEELYEEVKEKADALYQSSWITRQQRQNVDDLLRSSVPLKCCYTAHTLENANFISGSQRLPSGLFHEMKYGELLKQLKSSPQLVATLLDQGDKVEPRVMTEIVHIVVTSIYGNCVLQEDERCMLELLRCLIQLQLAVSGDPRHLLHRGSCAFSLVFKSFTDGLYSGKLYLTAALHDPVVTVLMQDEKYLDDTPERVLERLSLEEQARLFGPIGTPEFKCKLDNYVEDNKTHLVNLCKRFISSLKESMYCFPLSMDWIVTLLYKAVTKASKIDAGEARALCADVLLMFFIGPAVVDPQPYGIASELPISDIARFNLMRIAHILQILAMRNHSISANSSTDIYSRFPKNCMSSFVDVMIDSLITEEIPPTPLPLQGVERTCALIRLKELHKLVEFLRSTVQKSSGCPEYHELQSLLQGLPESLIKEGTAPGSQESSPNMPKKGKLGKKKSSITNMMEDCDINKTVLKATEEVLLITLDTTGSSTCPGRLDESEVLSSANSSKTERKLTPILNGDGSSQPSASEKQIRFELNSSPSGSKLDGGDVADTFSVSNSFYSDNIENASTMSGLENMSGSGRNTPRSTTSSNDPMRPEMDGDSLHHISSKLPNPGNITGRFCKFEEMEKELKNRHEADIDSWSTDVLPYSDSEPPPEHNPQDRLIEVSPDLPHDPTHNLLDIRPPQMDAPETSSETWSVDVIQSDSEINYDPLIDLEDNGDTESGLGSQLTTPESVMQPAIPEDDMVDKNGALQASHYSSPNTPREAIPDLAIPTNSLPSNSIPQAMAPGARPKLRPPSHPPPAVPEGVLRIFQPLDRPNPKKVPRESESLANIDGRVSSVPCNFDPLAESEVGTKSEDGGKAVEEMADPFEMANSLKPLDRPATTTAIDMFDPLVVSGDGEGGQETVEHRYPPVKPRKSALHDRIIKSEVRPPVAKDSNLKFNSLQEPSRHTVDHSDLEPVRFMAKIQGITESNNSSSSNSSEVQVNLLHRSMSEEPLRTEVSPPSKGKKILSRMKRSITSKGQKDKKKMEKNIISPPFVTSSAPTISESFLPIGKEVLSEEKISPPQDAEDIINKYKDISKIPKQSEVSSDSSDHMPSDEDPAPNSGGVDRTDQGSDDNVFTDAKRKLRKALHTADFYALPWLANLSASQLPAARRASFLEGRLAKVEDNQLIAFLKAYLAEAINLQNEDLISVIRETIRCIFNFNNEGCKKLLHSLKEDYKNRSPYITYLVRCRKGLLATQAHVNRLQERVERDKAICRKYLTSVCIRQFLERQKEDLNKFVEGFQKLKMADEKAAHVEEFLSILYQWIPKDAIWLAATDEQIEDAKLATEQAIMSSIYKMALYPNEDADSYRDQALNDHICSLQNLRPSHPNLKIPEKYWNESPWPTAQTELLNINIYKTPKDKVRCVVRCCLAILRLLNIADDEQHGADNLMPVLIYVIIKANPPHLLSLLDYVEGYYNLQGEESYYWTQFRAAVNFVKIFDQQR